MNKRDSSKKSEALRRTAELQNFNYAPNGLSVRVSNDTKDATFEQRLSSKDKRLLKDIGIAV